MNWLGCRLCLKKDKCAFVNALLIPELCKSIKNFFGFEILITDRCSTKVCNECISLITDALSYKNRVLYNQECIQRDILLQAQIRSIKVEEDDSDDVIFVENGTHNKQDELIQVTSSQVSPMTIKFKQTARKSTTKLPFHIYPTPKELCPKKLKVVCEQLTEKDIKGFCVKKRTREVKRRQRKDEPKRTPQRNAAVHSTPRNQSLEKRLENILTGSPKTAENNASKTTTPKDKQPKEKQPKENLTKPVYSQAPPIKSSNVKPTATVNPSDPKQQKVVWCGQISITNKSGVMNTTQSPRTNPTENIMRPIAPKPQHGETTIRKVAIPTVKNTLPTVTITRTPVSTMVHDSPLRATLIKKSDSYRAPSPSPQMNVVNTVYFNNPTLVCRANPGLNIAPAGTSLMPQNSVSMMNGHTYAIPYSPPAFNVNYKNGVLTSVSKPQMQCIDNSLSPQMNIHAMDKALAQNKVKVLSVNELNTRLSSPPGPTTISHEAAFKSQRLPIRISLTKVRNEMTIKLSDSQGREIRFTDLDESEAIAVRTSLLSKESIKNFGQAFQTCSPDGYTLGLLNKLGLNKASFLSLLPK